jgi:FtsZ-binding cell division protein ZapB
MTELDLENQKLRRENDELKKEIEKLKTEIQQWTSTCAELLVENVFDSII